VPLSVPVRNVCHNSSRLQVKECGSSTRRSTRTTIVAHRSACFGQNSMSTEDVHASDVSTVARESVTPLQYQYWCRVDKFMESGDLNDLCPESLDSDVDIDFVDRSVDGCFANGMSGNEDNIVSETNNVSYIPLNQCLMKTSFTVEERVLICLGQACNDTNVPLYLVDEIMEIIQDECDNGIRFDKIHFRKRESFMKHLFLRFQTPKANLLHIGIESLHPNNMEYRREFWDSVSVVYYNFLDQVNDLLNDISIWGDESNFKGTVDMKNPFSNDCIQNYGYVDEVNDGQWFHETNEE